MPSIATLRDSIRQQQTDLESKRKMAEDLARSADEHAARGDEVKAKLDRDSADRYFRDAEEVEKRIAGYSSEIEQREHKAAEIDRKIAELKSQTEREIQGLESKKRSVLVSIARDDNVEAAQRAIKDKHLNDEEHKVQDHYHREFDKLEREKKLIVG